MSTVLKAAQEIERRGRPIVASSVAAAGSDERVAGPWPWVFGIAGLTITAGIALVALQMSDDDVARSAPRAASAPVAAVAPKAQTAPPAVVASAAVAAASAPVAGVAVREPAPPAVQVAAVERPDAPWGRVDDDSTAPDVAPPPKPVVASLALPVPRPQKARTLPAAERAPSRFLEPVERAEPEPIPRSMASGAGVQIRQIFYADDISERAVSLRIGGGPAVILHQGESEQGVEVQLITRTGAYIRRGGSIYMVSGRR